MLKKLLYKKCVSASWANIIMSECLERVSSSVNSLTGVISCQKQCVKNSIPLGRIGTNKRTSNQSFIFNQSGIATDSVENFNSSQVHNA
jgi:hypothetical protein